MRKFDNIIHSNSAPPTNSLWLHNDKLQYHNNGKWTDIVSSVIQDGQEEITDIILTIGKDNPEAKLKFEERELSPLHDYVPVILVNRDCNAPLKILATFYNGQVTAIADGKAIIFNVDYNENWLVKETRIIDLTLLPTYVDLELGDSPEIEAYNREQLSRVAGTQFLVHADYGIGVGSWHPNAGGEATITTASGNRVHYILTADGACRRDADHFDHSELFYDLGVINLAEITPTTIINKEITDSVGVAQFKKASNVVLTVHTSNGDFEVNCPQVSMGPIQKTFNSPSIVAGNEDSWNYLKIIANIQTDPSKVLITIEAMQ